jgi:hypothetical protein
MFLEEGILFRASKVKALHDSLPTFVYIVVAVLLPVSMRSSIDQNLENQNNQSINRMIMIIRK